MLPNNRTQKLPSHLEAVLLAVLINGEKYGRQLRDAYEKRTGRALPLGSLYTTLDRMERKGFVKSRHGDPVPGRRGNRRKYFEIKGAGQRALDAYDIQVAAAYRSMSREV